MSSETLLSGGRQESDHSLPAMESFETFKKWAESEGIRIASDSPREIDKLFHDIQKGETTLVWSSESNEWHRFSASANVDVFYISSDGTKYKAREVRGKLKLGKTFADYLEDRDAITLSPARKAVSSLSERLHLTDGEVPADAAVRALREELLDHAKLAGNLTDKEISKMILDEGFYDNVRPADSPDSSYKGIPSTVKTYKFKIELSENSSIVIPVDEDGVPKPLYEVDESKGYVNEFVWDKVV